MIRLGVLLPNNQQFFCTKTLFSKSVRTIHLDKLKEGLPGITPTFGTFFAEAIAVCLHLMGHKPGVQLTVEGDFQEKFQVEWAQIITEKELSSWRDFREATEYGATGIALLLMSELTEFDFFERNDQGFSSDYALKKTIELDSLPVEAQQIASLEISGILSETQANTINIRINQKKNRKGLKKPFFVAVVEFGNPKAKIVQV